MAFASGCLWTDVKRGAQPIQFAERGLRGQERLKASHMLSLATRLLQIEKRSDTCHIAGWLALQAKMRRKNSEMRGWTF